MTIKKCIVEMTFSKTKEELEMDRRQLGKIGEDMAAEILRCKGYRILERNYRCRAGEIDIIADRYGELCFVEVKTRQGFNYGRPCEAVSYEKKKHIRSTAQQYLEELREQGMFPRRVDYQVIEVVVEHHTNAF